MIEKTNGLIFFYLGIGKEGLETKLDHSREVDPHSLNIFILSTTATTNPSSS
jgi:hypothetical protein